MPRYFNQNYWVDATLGSVVLNGGAGIYYAYDYGFDGFTRVNIETAEDVIPFITGSSDVKTYAIGTTVDRIRAHAFSGFPNLDTFIIQNDEEALGTIDEDAFEDTTIDSGLGYAFTYKNRFRYKGTKATLQEIEDINAPEQYDMWKCTADDHYYIYLFVGSQGEWTMVQAPNTYDTWINITPGSPNENKYVYYDPNDTEHLAMEDWPAIVGGVILVSEGLLATYRQQYNTTLAKTWNFLPYESYIIWTIPTERRGVMADPTLSAEWVAGCIDDMTPVLKSSVELIIVPTYFTAFETGWSEALNTLRSASELLYEGLDTAPDMIGNTNIKSLRVPGVVRLPEHMIAENTVLEQIICGNSNVYANGPLLMDETARSSCRFVVPYTDLYAYITRPYISKLECVAYWDTQGNQTWPTVDQGYFEWFADALETEQVSWAGEHAGAMVILRGSKDTYSELPDDYTADNANWTWYVTDEDKYYAWDGVSLVWYEITRVDKSPKYGRYYGKLIVTTLIIPFDGSTTTLTAEIVEAAINSIDPEITPLELIVKVLVPAEYQTYQINFNDYVNRIPNLEIDKNIYRRYPDVSYIYNIERGSFMYLVVPLKEAKYMSVSLQYDRENAAPGFLIRNPQLSITATGFSRNNFGSYSPQSFDLRDMNIHTIEFSALSSNTTISTFWGWDGSAWDPLYLRCRGFIWKNKDNRVINTASPCLQQNSNQYGLINKATGQFATHQYIKGGND